MEPSEAFGVGRGDTVAVVGAGGKKSTLYALAAGLGRAVLTATVRIPPFEGHVGRLVVTERPGDAVAGADEGDWPLGVVPGRDGDRPLNGSAEGSVQIRIAESRKPSALSTAVCGPRDGSAVPFEAGSPPRRPLARLEATPSPRCPGLAVVRESDALPSSRRTAPRTSGFVEWADGGTGRRTTWSFERRFAPFVICAGLIESRGPCERAAPPPVSR